METKQLTIVKNLQEKFSNPGTTILTVKISPSAKENQIISELLLPNSLKIKIKAPPDKGKANAELISFLSEIFNLSKSQIEIKTGHTSTLKIIKISH